MGGAGTGGRVCACTHTRAHARTRGGRSPMGGTAPPGGYGTACGVRRPVGGGGERLAHAPRRRACRPGQTREARGRQTAASRAQTRGPDGELQRPRSPRPACPLTRSPPPSPSEPRFLSVPEGAKLSAEEEEEEDTGLLPRTRPEEGLAESRAERTAETAAGADGLAHSAHTDLAT